MTEQKKHPDKEEWKAIEALSTNLFGRAQLVCDGYRITLRLVRASAMRNMIIIYVNGVFKGEWLGSKDPAHIEIVTRFLGFKEYSVHKRTEQVKTVKAIGKRRAEQLGFFKKIKIGRMFWTSFRALKAHLVKHNNVIEWVRDE